MRAVRAVRAVRACCGCTIARASVQRTYDECVCACLRMRACCICAYVFVVRVYVSFRVLSCLVVREYVRACVRVVRACVMCVIACVGDLGDSVRELK